MSRSEWLESSWPSHRRCCIRIVVYVIGQLGIVGYSMGRIVALYLMGLVFYKMGCPGQMEGGIRESRDQNS